MLFLLSNANIDKSRQISQQSFMELCKEKYGYTHGSG